MGDKRSISGEETRSKESCKKSTQAEMKAQENKRVGYNACVDALTSTESVIRQAVLSILS